MNKIGSMLVAGIIAIAMSGTIAQEKQAALTGVKVQSLHIQKKAKSEQIDRGQKGKAAGATTILDEAGRRNVSMHCTATDNNRRLTITVNNQNRSQRTCQSECYFRLSNGHEGTRRCEGGVPGGYNGEFCSDDYPGATYTVTSPGAFDCQQ